MDAPVAATRRTAQKEAVSRALAEAEGFISAQQLHANMATNSSQVGLATVYRQLNALADSGMADTITTPDGQLFRACRDAGAHHHHLICESCGKAVEIDPPSEEWIQRVASQHGFTVTRHVLEVFGLCEDCAARA